MVDKLDGYQSLGGSDKIKWGRQVSSGLVETSKDLARLRQDFQNTTASNRTTNAALSDQILIIAQQQELLEQQQAQLETQQEDIIAQQAYLASLTTDSIQGTNVLSTNFSGTPVVVTDNPTLTFTLPQELKCKITLRGNFRIFVTWGSTSVFAIGEILTGVRMDGSLYGGGQGSAYLSFDPNGANGNFASYGLIEAQVIVDIPAGTHTAGSYYSLKGTGSGGSLAVNNPTLTVEVIGLP